MRKAINKTLPFILGVVLCYSCQKNLKDDSSNAKQVPISDFTPKELKDFVQVNLVGDDDLFKPQNIDGELINGWGITFAPSGRAWVASEGKGLTPVYNLDGVPVSAAIRIPNSGSTYEILSADHGHPTGHVFNPTSDFKLANGNAAQIIFAGADGTISAWNNGSAAVNKIDNSPSASYTGATLAANGSEFYLYVANFTQNKIDVYDKNWNIINRPFTDPNLPAGYAPFNIQTLSDGKIYVTYAMKNASGEVETGQGNGIINVFNPAGTLLKRFATRGKLDAPWGIIKAPAGFWGEWSQLSNMILVANYGNGQISVFDENGNYLGPVYGKGKVIEIDGLRGIAFPPINGPNRYYLYFSSGPNDGIRGLVGYIKNRYIN